MKRPSWNPTQLPKEWQLIERFGPAGGAFYHKRSQLQVIVTESDAGDHGDDRAWLHVSVAHKGRLPTYAELCRVKSIWFGDEGKAMMIFAPRDKHVNIHPNCLHLYGVISGSDPLPEFSGVIGGVRTI